MELLLEQRQQQQDLERSTLVGELNALQSVLSLRQFNVSRLRAHKETLTRDCLLQDNCYNQIQQYIARIGQRIGEVLNAPSYALASTPSTPSSSNFSTPSGDPSSDSSFLSNPTFVEEEELHCVESPSTTTTAGSPDYTEINAMLSFELTMDALDTHSTALSIQNLKGHEHQLHCISTQVLEEEHAIEKLRDQHRTIAVHTKKQSFEIAQLQSTIVPMKEEIQSLDVNLQHLLHQLNVVIGGEGEQCSIAEIEQENVRLKANVLGLQKKNDKYENTLRKERNR